MAAVLSNPRSAKARQLNVEGLEYGGFEVGFEVFNAPDYSRRYKKQREQIFDVRPMVIGVWFPSTEKKLTTDELNELYRIAYSSAEGLSEDLEKTITEITKEQQNAEGSFPVILYSTGRTSSGYENTALCELLASHGYIVAVTASKGQYSRNILFNTAGVEAQSRDLEFLFGLMYNYQYADINNIGVVGYSFGAVNMLAYALKHRAIDAMVSFDGILTGGIELINANPTLDIENLETSLLSFFADNWELGDYFLDELAPKSDHIAIRTSGLTHLDFSSASIDYRNREEGVKKAYSSIANRTRMFMDMHLKGEEKSDEITELDGQWFIEILDVDATIKVQVLREDYIEFLGNEGVETAVKVYLDTKEDFPEYQLIDYESVLSAGQSIMEDGKVGDAVELFWLLIDAYPYYSNTYLYLTKALLQMDENIQAKAVATRGLQIDPNNEELNEILKQFDN